MVYIHVMCSIVLETDANVIAGKVATHSVDSGAPLSEQVLMYYDFHSLHLSVEKNVNCRLYLSNCLFLVIVLIFF